MSTNEPPLSFDENFIYVDQQSIHNLKCSLCQQIFQEPIITHCGHTFCRQCSTNTIVCPYDHQPMKILVTNHLIQQQIDSLITWCKYAFKKIPSINGGEMRSQRDEFGCPAKISLLKKKEHEDQCVYRFVPCPNGCQYETLRQKDLHQHLRICPKRHLTLSDTGSSMSTEQSDQLHAFQQEFHSKIVQMDRLVETCNQLTQTMSLVRLEIDSIKANQELLFSRYDLLLAELMKNKLTSPIPTTIDDQESIRSHHSEPDDDLPAFILRCNGTFTGHSDTVWCLHALDDLLLSGSSDKTVKIWNLRETPYTNLETLYGHEEGVLSIAVKDRTAFTGGADKSIFVWNLNDYKRLKSFAAHTDQVSSLTHFENHLYSSSNKCFKVWDMETLSLVDEVLTDERNGWLRVLMPKDKCIYVGCRRVVKVFDALTHQMSFEFELPKSDSICSLAHLDQLLFAGTVSGTIYIWDIRKNRRLETTCQHNGTVYGLRMICADNSNQTSLISASGDATLRVWSTDTFEQIQYDDRHEAEVTALHANTRHLMSGAADAKIKVWNCVSSYDYND